MEHPTKETSADSAKTTFRVKSELRNCAVHDGADDSPSSEELVERGLEKCQTRRGRN